MMLLFYSKQLVPFFDFRFFYYAILIIIVRLLVFVHVFYIEAFSVVPCLCSSDYFPRSSFSLRLYCLFNVS